MPSYFSRFTASSKAGITRSISDGDGQMSRTKTSLPSVSWPSGSLKRSTSMEPASAYATTRGGEAR